MLVWGVCFAIFALKTAHYSVIFKTVPFLKRNLFWQRMDSNGLDIIHTLFQAVEPGIEYDVLLYSHKTNFFILN